MAEFTLQNEIQCLGNVSFGALKEDLHLGAYVDIGFILAYSGELVAGRNKDEKINFQVDKTR